MVKRLSFQMAIPQIFAAMTGTLCMLIDGMVIGRLIGVDAMSSYGFATPLLILFTSLGTMMANGVHVVCAEALGRADMEKADSCYTTSIIMSFFLAACEFMLIFFCGNIICVLLGAGNPGTGDTIALLTREYLRGYVFCAPFFFLNQIAAPFMQSMGKRKVLLWSVATMIVTDVVADLVSVYVFHGGMFGIGVASAISYLAALLVCIGFFFKKDCLFHFSLKKFNLQMVVQLLRAGEPVILSQLFFVIRVRCYNHILLGVSGTTAVAAFSAISTLYNILFSIGLGSGAVILLLSSLFYNEEDRDSLKELLQSMVKNTFLLIASALLVFEFIAPWIIRIYFDPGTEVYTIGLAGFRIFALSLLVSCINALFKNYYQGIGHPRFTNLIAFLESVIFTVSFSRLLGGIFGLYGVWAGATVGQIVTFAVISVIVWKKYGRIVLGAESYCYLDRDFAANESEIFRFSVTDREGVIEASQKACEFLEQRGVDHKKSMLVGLCVEEIGMNTLTYGSGRNKRSNHLSICVIPRGEEVNMRFRDDCIQFDPTSYLELLDATDPFSHIGLRMVMELVKDASYINTFGLNNLTLVL